MTTSASSPLAAIPAVDRVLRLPAMDALIASHGRAAVTEAVRLDLDELRHALSGGAPPAAADETAIAARVAARLAAQSAPTLKRVFNLTGTVLHTNLGRAPLPKEAIDAMAEAAGAVSIEFDLGRGRRGDRDDHVTAALCKLTGSEAATVVNNNAAAVLLVLNTLANRREVPVSRGELIEIGGAFRMPDIMQRAGCKLVEVGTTNRTRAADYAAAIGPRTGAILRAHPSNFAIRGFTEAAETGELAALAAVRGVPLIVDLGSGALVDLRQFGLPREPTVAETVAAGADLVTFSGDKLLGGPQAGLMVGRAEAIGRARRSPLKRALRVDKITLAALGAVLALHGDPARLPARSPTLRLLTRPEAEIGAAAARLRDPLAAALGPQVSVDARPCRSQIGSGSLPEDLLPSVALAVAPRARKGSGAALGALAARMRALPIPVLGRLREGVLALDLRCLDDEPAFLSQLDGLRDSGGP